MSYEFWLTTDSGTRIALLNNLIWFDGYRVIDGVGYSELALPPSFDTRLWGVDRMLQVWRAPRGGRLRLWNVFFLRKPEWHTAIGRRFLAGGVAAKELLRRRVIPFDESDSKAAKTDLADDMMKEIVDEQMVSASTAARNWSNLTVAGDLGAGPSLTKTFDDRNLYRTLDDIALAAKTAGTEVWFDVVPSSVSASAISFQFRTYTGQPGRDLTETGIVFDEARGNMVDARLEYDYLGTINQVYAVGQGTEGDRETQEVSDSGRIALSAWNRREESVFALREETANGVRDAGRAALVEGEPVRRFTARAVDTAGTRYGADWECGDKVRVRYRDKEFDAIVSTVHITLRNGHETIDARLEYRA